MIKVKKFYNILIILSAIFVTLCTVEFVYRGYVYIKKPIHRPSSFPGLGWELTPGARRIENNIKEKPVTYSVNLSGIRDRTNKEWSKWKSDNIKIAFIGDSVTFGQYVEYKDVYSSVVETIFRKIYLPVRTVNMGIMGTNTRQHLATLKYKALRLNPDIVILGYFINDIERRKTQKLPSITRYILRRFHFGTFLIGRAATTLENREIRINEDISSEKGDHLPKTKQSCGGYVKKTIDNYSVSALEDNKTIILSMSELSEQKGIKFGVVIFPFQTQVNGICSKVPQEMLVDFLSKNGIPFLDVTKIYEEHISREKLYIQGDNIHPNKLGHYVAGKAISKWLISNPEFKKCFKSSIVTSLLNN